MSVTAINATNSKENSMTATTMKAIVADTYGPPEKLTVREIERPTIEADRVLIRVCAASINPVEIHGTKGGLVVRLTSGFRRPKTRVPGADVAGVIEAVGADVTAYRPGDEVFGTCAGSLAEFAKGRKNLVPKPANLSFEEAAAIPIAGVTALQGLRDKGRLKPGQSVLINGASGGVGTYAVQIAKAFGAQVTAVCSTKNVDLVRSLGADHVVDYTKEDFSRGGRQYDLVFDLVANRSLGDLRRVVKPQGTLVLCGGGHDRGHGARGLIAPMRVTVMGLLVNRFVSQTITFYIAKITPEDLTVLKELAEAGKLKSVIDRTYSLSEVPQAISYLTKGHARGKVVITV